MEITDRLVVKSITKETTKKFNALSIASSICKEAGIKATFILENVIDNDIDLIGQQKQAVVYQESFVVPYKRCTFIHNGSNITVKSEVKQINLNQHDKIKK